MTRVRDIAKILGVTEAANPTNAVLTSTADGSGGVTVYATKEDLPSSGLTSGDQAYVTANSRFYISNGSGWYNVALINATPSLTIDPTGAIELSTEGATTTITLTATDSDNAVAGLTYSVESDGSFGGLATLSQDSSVFTITPLSEDSATTETSTLTFKASDGISFGSGTTTFTLSFVTVIENSNYTRLLAKANASENDNQVDASSNNHTITENGNVTSTAFTPYHPGGYSTYFDGSGDYLSISGPATGVGTWTLEGWFYFNTLVSNRALFSQGTADNTGGFIVWSDSNGTITFYSNGVIAQTSGAVNANEWAHIALVSNSNSITIFVNGVSVGTGSYSGKTFNNSPFQINRGYGGITEGNNCYIADVRLVNNTAVYTSNFTPPTERLTAIANTSLFTCHAPYIADGSTNSHAITVNGNTLTKRFGPYDTLGYTKADHGGSLYFDGVSGTKLTIPVSASLQKQAGGDFTFEAWIYPTARTSYDMIVTCGDQGVDFGYTFFWHNTSYHLMFEAGTSGWASTPYTSSSNDGIIQLNEWQHVAFMYSGGNLTLFRNGKVALYQASAQLAKIATSGLFALGGYMDGGTQYPFKGYMANARVTQSAVYTSNTNFTPPTAPLTAIANTSLLTCTNKNDIWDASTGNLLTKVGNTTASNTQRKFAGSSAVYFDGTGDYLTFAPGSRFAFGTGDFTIECWVYFNSYETSNGFFVGQNFFSSVFQISNGILQFYSQPASAYVVTGSTALPQNEWVHVAVTRSGNTFKVFLNGSVDGTGTNSSDAGFNSANLLTIGAWNNLAASWTGYMQDLRVTKGLARYTATFTPPTAEFEG